MVFFIHPDVQQFTRINLDSSVPYFYVQFLSPRFHWTTSVQATKFPCLDSPVNFLIFLTPALTPCKPCSTLKPESTSLHIWWRFFFFFPHLKPLMSFKGLRIKCSCVTWPTLARLFLWLLNSLASSDKPSIHPPTKKFSRRAWLVLI